MSVTIRFQDIITKNGIPKDLLSPSSNYELFHFKDTNKHGMDNLPHLHHYYELMYIIEGTVTILSNGVMYEAAPNTICIIPPGCTHCSIVPDGTQVYERMIFHWTVEYNKNLSGFVSCNFEELFNQLYILKCNVLQSSTIRMLFEHIEEEQKKEDPYGRILCLTNTIELLTWSARILSTSSNINIQLNKSNIVSAVIAYIERHYHESDLDLKRITDKFYCSSGYLSKLFRALTGITVYQFIIYCRVLYVQEELVKGRPILEACLESGFTDYTSFLKAFRKITGKTPRQYRQELQTQYYTFNTIGGKI